MEEPNSRVLAYALAKPILHDELDQIAGGKQGFQGGIQCTSRTLSASGAGHEVDATLDVRVDW